MSDYSSRHSYGSSHNCSYRHAFSYSHRFVCKPLVWGRRWYNSILCGLGARRSVNSHIELVHTEIGVTGREQVSGRRHIIEAYNAYPAYSSSVALGVTRVLAGGYAGDRQIFCV